ncbi:hypothetical protein Deipe_1509 [Deinococcus peraridilitoris DSM 19664]|uniref:Uncharacterized protein n=1 Tax=Deinococcus peraridilitoris (strain DSM 19664 / LMG 22246 / CIP 109416 / KR-200) TaxID=937777 RepID=L0A218_DEIPD|nr:hypothetical protein Deipe_1509 [Deinococcus peraridilitoris DSM 19664]
MAFYVTGSVLAALVFFVGLLLIAYAHASSLPAPEAGSRSNCPPQGSLKEPTQNP